MKRRDFLFASISAPLLATAAGAQGAGAGPTVILASRETLVWWTRLGGALRTDGIVRAGNLAYRARPGATEIPDLPGWIPEGPAFVGHYGARGDTNTSRSPGDETRALQAALTASAHRPLAFAPGRVYRFGAPGLTIPGGAQIDLNGAVLRVTGGAHDMARNAALRIAGPNVRLARGEVDFNHPDQSRPFNGLCGFDNSHDAVIDSLVLRGCPRRSLVTNASPDPDPVVPPPRRQSGWRLSNIRIFDAQDKALQVRKSYDVIVADCVCETNIQKPDRSSDSAFECSRSEQVEFINCTGLHRVRGYGPTFRAVNASRHVTFRGGSGYGGRQGLFCSDSKHVRFLDIVIRDTGKSGALIQASNLKGHAVWGEVEDITIQGCTFLNPTGDGIVINLVHNGVYVRDVRLIGNYIDSDASSKMAYGLRNAGDTTGTGRQVECAQAGNTINGAAIAPSYGTCVALRR